MHLLGGDEPAVARGEVRVVACEEEVARAEVVLPAVDVPGDEQPVRGGFEGVGGEGGGEGFDEVVAGLGAGGFAS